IIAWGNNPVVSMTGYFGRFQKMMDNGGTLCTIDPFLSETADKSQEWLRPWPGSDAALTMGMIKVILDEGLQKDDYLKAHTTAPCLIDCATGASFFADAEDTTTYQVVDADGTIKLHTEAADPMLTTAGTEYEGKYVTELDLLKAEAAKWDGDAVKAETDVDFDDYARVARDYANAKHGMIIQNMGGYQRTENAAFATAVQCYMALLCGHVGHEGDGVYDATGSAFLAPAGKAFEVNPEAQNNPETIPIPHFGDFIEAEKPCKINLYWSGCGNPVSQMPNSNDNYRKGLSLIPYVIKSDIFFNATCEYADLVLPVTALFETPNITHTVRSTFIQLSEAGVTPPGECKTDLEITALVAERFGLEKYFNEDPDVYIERVVAPALEVAGITYEEFKERKAIDALTELNPDYIAYKDGTFLTPTGKAQFVVASWGAAGYPTLATHIRPQESILNGGKYPLASVQRKTRSQVHTTFKNLETMLEMDGHVPSIYLSPEDASARGISNGDNVTVFNDRGECVGIAKVTDKCKTGVVVLENGWDDVLNGRKYNTSNVTNNLWPTLGTIHCCNSTMVDVKKGA
ncbi:MAG: molybdopterin-dependent oxidoreductase, partial [Eggerthellales bacterium]|nr:molybdopterin-dependent oxidoreductase [Eggerthellales bacterium]